MFWAYVVVILLALAIRLRLFTWGLPVLMAYVTFIFLVGWMGQAGMLLMVGTLLLGGLWWGIRRYTTHLLLRLTLAVESPRVSQGGVVRFVVTMTPSRTVAVSRCDAVLRGVRTTQFRGPAGFPGYRERVVEGEYRIVLFEREALPKGEPRILTAEFPVPSDAAVSRTPSALSESSRTVTVRWDLIVEARLPFSPAAVLRQEIVVEEREPERLPAGHPLLYPGDASEVVKDREHLAEPPPEPSPARRLPRRAGRATSFSHLEIDAPPKKEP